MNLLKRPQRVPLIAFGHVYELNVLTVDNTVCLHDGRTVIGTGSTLSEAKVSAVRELQRMAKGSDE